jgi:hypothetical protein
MDEFNRRLARADGLKAEPDPELGGPLTWCGPAWPTQSDSMRHNGPRLNSGRVSKPSLPGTD